MKRIWKDVVGYESMYKVSNFGEIYSCHSGDLKKIKSLRGDGYMNVVLSKQSKKNTFYVHRLVMAAFVGLSKLQVNHKNGDRKDNRLCNLEYCTSSQNIKHSYCVLGRKPLKGEMKPTSKLKDGDIPNIKRLYSEGHTQLEISNMYGVSRGGIGRIVRGKIWKHC